VAEAIRWLLKAQLPRRRIAAEGDDVLNSGVFDVFEDLVDLSGGGTDAGEMTGGGNFVFVLDKRGDLQGAAAGAAKSAVGDSHVVGLEGDQFGENATEMAECFVGLWREDFEGDDWLFLVFVKFG
jgi:hypothetical protein